MVFCKNKPSGFFGSQVSKLIKKNSLFSIVAAIFLLVAVGSILIAFRPSSNPIGVTKIVIDPGHGGHDSGCLGKAAKEKDVALGIALKLGKYIEDNYSDVKVIYTRKTDEFVELHERAAIANNAKADLFICIHCNSACFLDKRRKEVCNTETNGVETWVMGLHKSEANLEVSKRENSVVLLEKDYVKQYEGFDPNSPEANIIFSLYQNAYLDQSLRMASYVQREVKAKGRSVRGVKQAGFLVLFKTSMPSVLIETGFLSNPDEEDFLNSKSGQEKMASAIFKAFRSYKMSIENMKSSVEFGLNKNNDEETEKEVHSTAEVKEEKVTETESTKISSTDKKVEENTEVELKNSKKEKASVGLFWGVQFYTSPNRIKSSDQRFKGIADVRVDFENSIYKYSTGNLSNYKEALNLQSKIRKLGFEDAFVIGFYDDKKISLKEAMQIKNNGK